MKSPTAKTPAACSQRTPPTSSEFSYWLIYSGESKVASASRHSLHFDVDLGEFDVPH